MTGAQASYLKTLSEQAHDPKAFDPDLDKAEASKRIDQLKQKQGSEAVAACHPSETMHVSREAIRRCALSCSVSGHWIPDAAAQPGMTGEA